MKSNIYIHNFYLDIIKKVISLNPQRGFKSKLAAAAGCQLSFLSQALSEVVNLTEDQLYGIANFLKFDDDEKEYFLLLLRREKCSSKTLRLHLDKKIHFLKKSKESLSQRIEVKENTSDKMEKYYSAWYYSAIHVALSIPKIKTIDDLKRLLRLSKTDIKEAIDTLCSMNLIESTNKFYRTIEYDLHIKSDRPLFRNYNMIWRNYLLFRIQNAEDNNLHYTAVHSMSSKDYEKLRENFIEFIQDSRKLVETSVEEELVAVSIDLLRF